MRGITDIFTDDVRESRVWIDDQLLQDEGITVLISSEEPALPSMRNISVTVPGRHGAYDFGAYLEPREFTLNVVFPRQSYTDLKRQIREFNRRFIDIYGRPKTVKLRFGDEVDKFYYVRLTEGIPVERSAERGFLILRLSAFDPYAYSTVTAEEVTWGSDVITFEWNYKLGHKGSEVYRIRNNTKINYEVEGMAVSPTIEISGRADNLVLEVNGNVIKFSNFSGTDFILNFDRYVVLRDGVETMEGVEFRDFSLIPGNNELSVEGRNMDISLKVSYRDKYI